MSESSQQYLGAYNGVSIRCRHSDLISMTDIWRANSEPSSLRPDRWLKQSSIQDFLRSMSSDRKVGSVLNKSGMVIEVPGVVQVFRGGDRFSQGTFACSKVMDLYTQAFSDDCNKWFLSFSELFDDFTEPVKAKRETIPLGSNIKLHVYQMPNGEYQLSQTQCAEAIVKHESSFRKFLASDSPEALPYKGFRSAKIGFEGNNALISPTPIPIAVAYWTKESIAGNQEASRLLGACAVESIERRADKAFGVVRTEEEYNERFDKVFKQIIAESPKLTYLSSKSEIKVSAPVASFYSKIQKVLKKSYSESSISKKSIDELRKEFVYLSSFSSDCSWRLTPQQEISYKIATLNRYKYPDLLSGVINFKSGTHDKTAVFIFQIYDFLVTDDDVAECILKRRYIELTKQSFKVDYAYVFLMAPFGASFAAEKFIHEHISEDLKSFIGILTFKEVLEFYQKQATDSHSQSTVKGNIKKKFAQLLDYKIPANSLDIFSKENIHFQLSLDLESVS